MSSSRKAGLSPNAPYTGRLSASCLVVCVYSFVVTTSSVAGNFSGMGEGERLSILAMPLGDILFDSATLFYSHSANVG